MYSVASRLEIGGQALILILLEYTALGYSVLEYLILEMESSVLGYFVIEYLTLEK